jgi:hypothetical protein
LAGTPAALCNERGPPWLKEREDALPGWRVGRLGSSSSTMKQVEMMA